MSAYIDDFVKRHDKNEVEYRTTRALACYLISLFYKSGCKYWCPMTKINRLLTIYKLSSVQFDQDCFAHSFVTAGDYIMINDLIFIDRDVYFLFDEADNKEEYTGNFEQEISIPSKYQGDDSLVNEHSKRLLEMIFRKFASYSVRDLAPLINAMHHQIPFKENHYNGLCNELDVSEFLQFLNSEENNVKFKDNEVFKFIKDVNNDLLEHGWRSGIDGSFMYTTNEENKVKVYCNEFVYKRR